MKCYFGYPDSFLEGERFRIKDLFLQEVNVDYFSVPIEVKKKLLSVLDNLQKKRYLFIGNVFYDAIDVFEFSLFPLPVREFSAVILPGYLYGKSTYLIKNLLKNVFGVLPSFYYDFNFFSSETLVVNVGYTQTSFSFGGKYLLKVPIGEFHFVDFLGSYLFNRFLSEVGVSNTLLRKSGKRGEILDRLRGTAGRILFKGSELIEVPEYGYKRKIEKREIDSVFSALVGSSSYGNFVERPLTISSFLVHGLYRFEELLKERFKVREVVVIGRLRSPFVEAVRKVMPMKVYEDDGENLLERNLEVRRFRLICEKGELPKLKIEKPVLPEKETEDVSLENLRRLFNKRDLGGVFLIEKLSLKGGERVIYEFLNMLKRCSLKSREDLIFLNYLVSALSKMEIPGFLFKKVLYEIEKKAFLWEVPLAMKFNVLFFCYKYRDRLKGTKLEIFPFVFSTFVRKAALSEGERNFLKTVMESVFS